MQLAKQFLGYELQKYAPMLPRQYTTLTLTRDHCVYVEGKQSTVSTPFGTTNVFLLLHVSNPLSLFTSREVS